MSHVVRRPAWGVIDLDTDAGQVLVREDWKYNWAVEPGAAAWTLAERRRFHGTADRHVWGAWSGQLRLNTSGGHELCRRLPQVSVNFDIRWVLSGGQWTVNVVKLRAGSASPRSYVQFATRTIQLDTLDVDPHGVQNDAGVTRNRFFTIPHEFGHTLPAGSGSRSPVDDEYGTSSAHVGDADSIMNIGRQVRSRHVTAVIDELDAMLPGCSFSA